MGGRNPAKGKHLQAYLAKEQDIAKLHKAPAPAKAEKLHHHAGKLLAVVGKAGPLHPGDALARCLQHHG